MTETRLNNNEMGGMDRHVDGKKSLTGQVSISCHHVQRKFANAVYYFFLFS